MKKQFQELLKDFEKLSASAQRDATYMEISGYPHYENVCSNILSFFLDPLREHRFNDLLIKSLLETTNRSVALSNISVEREYQTSSGRIDILIESDSHIIVIENKIFHIPNNPFMDYKKKAESLAVDRDCIYILLGLEKEESSKIEGFESITYDELFSKVKSNIGNYIQESSNKYLVFLTEFISSVENLSCGSNVDKSVIEFFAQNESETKNFIDAFNAIKRELRNKISNMRQNLTIDESIAVRCGFHRESNVLGDCFYYDLNLEGEITAIDCYIFPHGWEITIFPRSYGSTNQLEKALENRGIPFKSGERLVYGDMLGFDEPEDNIAKVLEGLIEKLHNASNN